MVCAHVLSRITPQIFFLYDNVVTLESQLLVLMVLFSASLYGAMLFSEATLLCLKLLVNAMENSIPAEQGTNL